MEEIILGPGSCLGLLGLGLPGLGLDGLGRGVIDDTCGIHFSCRYGAKMVLPIQFSK